MEFIKIAYCVTVPVLLCYVWLNGARKKWAVNLLALNNLLLIGNSFFLVQQLWGLYRLSQYFPAPRDTTFQGDVMATARLFLVLLLPFFSLIGNLRKNSWFSLVLLVVVYNFYPFATWNLFDLETKIPQYLCLLCAGYALLWLCNRLPYQSSPN